MEITNREVAVEREDAGQRAFRLDALVSELSGTGATAKLGLAILRYLDQFGPCLLREIPQAWPLKRPHVRAMASRLAGDGLLAYAEVGGPGAPRPLKLTDEGTRVLEEIDWNETIRLLEEENAS
jgi:hypothetical protein